MPTADDKADRTDTRDAILDAAEELFATNGFAATSLRQLTSAAGVNLAAVHYHFGSKEKLLAALFERRLGPINEERLRLLSQAEESAAPEPAPVEAILRAFVEPPLLAGMGSGAGCGVAHFIKLVGRSHAQETAAMSRIFHEQFAGLIRRFSQALRQALPGLPEEDLYWRMHFCAGAFSHTLMNRDKVRWSSNGLCDPDDAETVIDQMIAFLTAGMSAASSQPSKSAKKAKPEPKPKQPAKSAAKTRRKGAMKTAGKTTTSKTKSRGKGTGTGKKSTRSSAGS